MSRSKKSRKSAPLAPRNKPVAMVREARRQEQDDKKPKKRNGLQPGSRNSAFEQKTEASNQAKVKKDPRLGSKKPIALIVDSTAVETVQAQAAVPAFEPTAKLVKDVPVAISPELELEQLENDETLLALLERVDGGEVLKGKGAKYFNKAMARHQELVTLLGLDDDFDEDDEEDQLAQFMDKDWKADFDLDDEDKA